MTFQIFYVMNVTNLERLYQKINKFKHGDNMLSIYENAIGKTLIDEHNNYVITNIAINNKFKEWCDFNPTMNRLKNILNISENKMSELCNNIQELELFIADNRTHEIKMCKTNNINKDTLKLYNFLDCLQHYNNKQVLL